MKTAELTGAALDWAVAKCEGRREPDVMDNFAVAWYTWGNTHYSTAWNLGGPIIEREGIQLVPRNTDWEAAKFGPSKPAAGPTPLIAAMRCYVASKFGDEVEIPQELT